MVVVFIKDFGAHRIGDRDEIPVEIANKMIEQGVCLEYKGTLKISNSKPKKR